VNETLTAFVIGVICYCYFVICLAYRFINTRAIIILYQHILSV